MKTTARHIRIFFSIAVALLCFVVCRADVTAVAPTTEPLVEVPAAIPEECAVTDAALIEKEDDMLRAVHEMGCWGMPSTSITLQGAAGRVLSVGKTLQRISRVYGALCASEPRHAHEQDGALRHALLTKRFHAGYYIYYRCQMRC